jgi:8-oxo-dGTP pyrophosphatase MutT (NUDIX family)
MTERVRISRRAARVLLVDGADRVLLFRGFDPTTPDDRYWFTVGGGIDPGETAAEAGVRELREETGLVLSPAELGEPVWHDVDEFPIEDTWYHQEQEFFLARVPRWEVDNSGWDAVERRTMDIHRWWSIPELAATTERFYPEELPDLLRRLLGLDTAC